MLKKRVYFEIIKLAHTYASILNAYENIINKKFRACPQNQLVFYSGRL